MNNVSINNRNTFLVSVCIGAAVSLVVSIVLALIVSLCINSEYLNFKTAGYVVTVSLGASAFIGSLTASRLASKRILLVSCVTSGAYYLIMIAIGMLFLDGVGGNAILGLASCAVGCLTSFFVSFKWNSRTVIKKKRRRSR